MHLERRHLISAGICAALVLLLQLPILVIGALVSERQQRQHEAVSEVSAKWGAPQTVIGPWVAVPYSVTRVETVAEESRTVTHREVLHLLPEELEASVDLQVEVRHRGLFDVPVYVAALKVAGKTHGLDPSDFPDGATIHWDRARLAMAVSDPRAIQGAGTFRIQGSTAAALPTTGPDEARGGLHVPLNPAHTRAGVPFELDVSLRGVSSLNIVPVGDVSHVELRSNWDAPSFQGKWLPEEHQVRSDGFAASWTVSRLSRGFPARFTTGRTREPDTGPSRGPADLTEDVLGVDLLRPVDHYRMSLRATHYSFLFVALALLTLWLLEIRSARHIHPVQYGLVGAALCLFFLLLLALSEHLGFALAYGVATAMIVGLISSYAWSLMGELRRAALVGLTLAGMHGWLYITLANEDYALLLGSMVVFAGLALTMLVTRGMGSPAPSPGELEPEDFDLWSGPS